ARLELAFDLTRGRSGDERIERGRDREHCRREQQRELDRQPRAQRAERAHRSIIHRHGRGGRPEPDRECRRALSGSHILLPNAGRSAQIWMPGGQPARRIRGIAEGRHALRIRARRPHAVGDDNERAHLVVDVAPERDHAGLVEMHRARLVLREQLQLEPLGGREGIDVMLGRIEVGKGDVRAHRHDRQEGVELDVLLRNDIAPARPWRAGRIPCRVERDDGVADRMARGIDDAHRKRGCGGPRGPGKPRRERYKSTHHNHPITRARVNSPVCERGYQRIRSSAWPWVWRWRGARPCSSSEPLRLETWSSSTSPVKWPKSRLPAIIADQPRSSYSSVHQPPRLRVPNASARTDNPNWPNGRVSRTKAERKRLSTQRRPSST